MKEKIENVELNNETVKSVEKLKLALVVTHENILKPSILALELSSKLIITDKSSSKNDLEKLENIPSLSPLEALSKISDSIHRTIINLSLACRLPLSRLAITKYSDELSKYIYMIVSPYCASIMNNMNISKDTNIKQFLDDNKPTGLIGIALKPIVLSLLESITLFTNDIQKILELSSTIQDDKKNEKNDKLNKFVNQRLISTGKIWEDCKKLRELNDLGPWGIFKKLNQTNIIMIKSASDDLNDWLDGEEIKDPWDFDEDLNNDDFNTNNENENENKTNILPKQDESQVLKADAKLWLTKFRSIIDLWNDISLDSNKSKFTIDVLNTILLNFHNLTAQCDELACLYFEDSDIDSFNETKASILDLIKNIMSITHNSSSKLTDIFQI